MRDIGDTADSSGGYLSQLKSFYGNASFARKGLFSGIAFFSFGLTGVVPVLPQTDPGVFASKEITRERAEKSAPSTDERCYWQEDVKFFTTLQEKKSVASKTEIPCEAIIAPKVEIPKTEPIRSDSALSEMIQEMTVGYPMEAMAPAIAKYDREVAGLIVGIAKKESNWGKRVPLDANGADCFNYWGYKGAGSRGVAMGHGCFGSPEEAVEAVGNRLAKLVELRQTSEPKNMIIWKCGSSCKDHSDASVSKWISDVDIYYKQIAKN